MNEIFIRYHERALYSLLFAPSVRCLWGIDRHMLSIVSGNCASVRIAGPHYDVYFVEKLYCLAGCQAMGNCLFGLVSCSRVQALEKCLLVPRFLL